MECYCAESLVSTDGPLGSFSDGTYSVQAELDLGTGPSLLSSPYSLILADGEPMLLDL